MKYLKLFESFQDLRDILLSEDGETVTEVLEEDLDRLIDDGEFFDTDEYEIITIGMRQSKCHSNSAAFYENFINDENNSEDEIEIVTGWALLDGDWVQHSWLLLTYDYQIIETTSLKRDIYYGVRLNNKETELFLYENY